MSDRDFSAHNREVEEIWAAYRAGDPIRVPMILGTNVRYWLLTPWLNPRRVTFRDYSEDPEVMMRTQLDFQHYVRHHLPQDAEMGMPKDCWDVWVDLQNYYEAAWFGCPVYYPEGQVPDTEPILSDDRKRMLFDRGIPDPFRGGSMATNLRFHEYMQERIKDYTFMGLPVTGGFPSGLGTDGPFTTAASLRGAMDLCLDIYEDPAYVHDLLDYITEATIVRIRAWRTMLGHDPRPTCWGLADDSIQLLSPDAYREFVLPCHRRLLRELAGPGPHMVHLCGDATRYFRTIRDELNAMSFDTGFPVDFGALREELGPSVEIKGGPHVSLLAHASPDEVRADVRRILSSGITRGGRFILREANNLAPSIPEENLAAMYEAVKEYGRYAR